MTLVPHLLIACERQEAPIFTLAIFYFVHLFYCLSLGTSRGVVAGQGRKG